MLVNQGIKLDKKDIIALFMLHLLSESELHMRPDDMMD